MNRSTFIHRAVVMMFGLMFGLIGAITLCWSSTDNHWVVTWSAVADQAGPALRGATIRQVVHTSIGGSNVRIRLSNLFGTGPITIESAHLALHATGSAIQAGSDHPLTFQGVSTLKIAKGESALSDPISMPVTALQELAISLYLPANNGPSTIHGVGMETAYIKRGSDMTAAISLASAKTDESHYFLTNVEVTGTDTAGVIVAIGDSIADGVGSTMDAGNRWSDVLASRLQKDPALKSVAVANTGIAGNRILQDAADPFRGQSALNRFDPDALSMPGVRWIILDMGLNDIGAASLLGTAKAKVSSQQIIEGMQTLITRAHEKNIKIIGTTVTPFSGVHFGSGKHPYYSSAGEAKRQEVNTWIRSAHAFDAVADFDQVLRDPDHPEKIRPAYDSGDHLHPNDAGHKALAEAIDLHIFSASGSIKVAIR
ncbi:SGNH/GDSL hydrolase family protein [Solimicrobium silvestre]|uniref:GDSL-like Lipase/Acylhydrolase family n=1 Tax=Solimicrobium silvestre TaxID=2099400 RepID=A0A2S9H4F5_9BURK|nr:SGNH/GDSL hydrolase family protein [Solimicrobium silvestre]PRC94847.1 GDSL-like Lipase/Acylhydrolase family [Solimicrobium silvestre]